MNKEIYNKLTDSAKSALEDALTECKDWILDEAYSIAALNQPEVIEISLSDILSARKKIFSQDKLKADMGARLSRAEIRKQYFKFLLTILLLAYVFVGCLFILRSRYNIDFLNDSSFMIITFGFALILYIFVLYRTFDYRRKMMAIRKDEAENLDRTLENTWDRISYLGKILYGYMVSQLIDERYTEEEKNKYNDVRSYVDLITISLDPSLQEPFKELLRIRNIIVHGDSESVTREEKEEAISTAKLIVAILKRKVINDISFVDESSIEEYYNKDYHNLIDEFDSASDNKKK